MRTKSKVRLDAELSSEDRNNLAAKTFVFPKERRFPIPDLNHARNALARSAGTGDEAAVKAAVFKKFGSLKEHDKHDDKAPVADCPHCMDDAAAATMLNNLGAASKQSRVAALASEHDEKHGRHEDCPNCAARKDGAACDMHADDNLALEHGGPVPTAPVSGEEGERQESMRGDPGEGSPAAVESGTDPDDEESNQGRKQTPMRGVAGEGSPAKTEEDPDEDDLEDGEQTTEPGDGGGNFQTGPRGDDTLTPNGPLSLETHTGGEMEAPMQGSLDMPMQPPAPAESGMLANPSLIQAGSTANPWTPQGASTPHPMTGKTVRWIHKGGEGGSLGADGGRITHGSLGKVESVDNDGNTALIDWDGHGKSRHSLINIEEAKQKPAPTRADRFDGVTRYDVGELEKPEYMANGWVKVDGYIARSGMLRYTTDDGRPWIEYRPPDEAFDQKTLDSFSLVPMTNTHPPEGLLDASNTSKYQTGSVDTPRRDGDKVRARMLITDASAVKAMKRGRVELSCGYTCDVDNTPGEVNGVRYDAIQRNVRGNHVALVDVGRAGSEVRIRTDGLGMVQLSSSQQKDPNLTTKIKIDGVEFDVSENGAQAFKKHMDNAAREIEKQKARADANDTEAKRLKAELKLAPEKVKAAIENRAAIEQDARKILGAGTKFDGLSDVEVKRQAAEKHRGVKLDDKQDAYIEAAFDLAVAHADGDTSEAGILAPRAPVEGALETADGAGLASRKKYVEASLNASQPKSRK